MNNKKTNQIGGGIDKVLACFDAESMNYCFNNKSDCNFSINNLLSLKSQILNLKGFKNILYGALLYYSNLQLYPQPDTMLKELLNSAFMDVKTVYKKITLSNASPLFKNIDVKTLHEIIVLLYTSNPAEAKIALQKLLKGDFPGIDKYESAKKND